MVTGFGNFFDAFFGQSFHGGSSDPRDGAHLGVRASISLHESHAGVTRTIPLRRNESCAACKGLGAASEDDIQVCPTCRGEGQVAQGGGFFQVVRTCPECRGTGRVVRNPCEQCRGAGRVRRERSVEVRFPAGIGDGDQLRVSGEGDQPAPGGRPGDLVVEVTVEEHDIFKRHGRHLVVDVPVGFATAALGGTLDVPTFDGVEHIDVPPGSQQGALVRVAGLGFPDPRSGRDAGDLVCVLHIDVPSKPIEEYRELVRRLAPLEAASPTPKRKEYLDNLERFRAEFRESRESAEHS